MKTRFRWASHPVAAGIVGVFAGALAVALIEAAAHALLGTADPADPASITPPMFASVLVAWIAGAFVAAAVATYWTRDHGPLPGTVAGLVLFAATLATLFAFPHPGWVIAASVLLMPAAAWFGARWRAVRNA
jgi:hypothetical protein